MMARRRLFSLDIVDTDAFLDLPCSSQALYFHLGMRADDDGFVSSPKRITSTVNAASDDLKLLITKGFIIPFDTGVCVIRDWRVHNTIQKDRYKPTLYQLEKAMLQTTASNSYCLMDTECIQDVSIPETQDKLSKDKLREDNLIMTIAADTPQPPASKTSKTDGDRKKTRFIPPSVDEVEAYCKERGNSVDAQHFVDYYTANGWVQGKDKPIKNWKACVNTWERRDKDGTGNNGFDRVGGRKAQNSGRDWGIKYSNA